jgi:hypothetical protein
METRDARRALLARLIDHAPTFPPAALAPAEAIREDERAEASSHAFALARLVWPASKLGELPASSRALSVVLDGELPESREVEAVEVRYGDGLAGLEGVAPEVYVELRVDDALEARLDELAGRGLRAKIRCGGGSAPHDDELARFVRACRERGLVFKATAGLHRAVRSNGDHGFLNLLAAATFAGDEDAALAEVDPEAFSLDSGSFSWRDRTASAVELERMRRDLLHSIGSCSFFEPIEELGALGVLPT